jgi:hypothetical protein
MISAVQLRFHPSERSSLSLIDDNASNPTAYIAKGPGITNISFFYKDNWAIGAGWRFCPSSSFLGYHPNDIEYVSIYEHNGAPAFVYFSAHNAIQGTWVPFEECETTDDGKTLIIYVARGSHANYPHKGIYWRAFGFANDVCSDRGPVELIPLDKMIPSFDHVFPNGIRLFRGLRPFPPVSCLTSWQKFIIPFSL